MPSATGLTHADAALAEELSRGLQEVCRIFDDHLTSRLEPVHELVRYVERYRGKMLRPALTLVSGMAAQPGTPLTREHCIVGAVVEMVHMATLVHDDVLDDADVRRRGATINRLRGNEAAVMLGDYLFASAYHLCAMLPTTDAARAVARASTVLCEGELLQLHARGNFDLTERDYFDIISRKTGELIAVSAELGAACSNATLPVRDALRNYAMHAGIAFQIQDDLLDLLGSESVVGKSVGKDIQMEKATLPLIHHLAVATREQRERTLTLLERTPAGGETATLRARVIESLRETGSIEFARSAASRYVDDAIAALRAVPESPAREHLARLARGVVDRAS